MEKIELFENMKSMSKDELNDYMSTVKFARNICNVAGVTAVLLALTFTNVYMVIFACIVLWVFGQIAVGTDVTQDFIVKLLETKFSDK